MCVCIAAISKRRGAVYKKFAYKFNRAVCHAHSVIAASEDSWKMGVPADVYVRINDLCEICKAIYFAALFLAAPAAMPACF